MKETKEQAIQAIIEYFQKNEDVFNRCIEELDLDNGCLKNDRIYNMEDLQSSTDYKDYSTHLHVYTIQAMADNRYWLDSTYDNVEISNLFDKLKEIEREKD